MNNNYHRSRFDGAVIDWNFFFSFTTFNISNCNFSYNGFGDSTIILFGYPLVSFAHNIIYLSNSNYQNNKGTSIYVSSYYILHINGEVLFDNNTAHHGAGIHICCNSSVIFDRNSNVKFVNNFAYYGAAIFLRWYSIV